MGRLKKFADQLKRNKKMQVCFFTLSMIVLIALYVPVMYSIRETREKANIEKQGLVKDYKILFKIEEFTNEKEVLSLNGWLLRLGSENIDVKVVYRAIDGSDIEVASVSSDERNSINNYFSVSNDFGKSGFVANIKKNVLQENLCYEILFVLDYKIENEEGSKKISSGKFVYNGELYHYNPTTYVAPKFADNKLNTVLKDGILRFYDSEMGCWIYSYENQLYLIINDKFGLKDDRTYRMKFHTHTAQWELLSEGRRQYGFDSRDFFFDEKEYVLSEESEYRVAVLDIPDNYEVSWIELGMYEVGGAMLRDMSFLLSNWNELK